MESLVSFSITTSYDCPSLDLLSIFYHNMVWIYVFLQLYLLGMLIIHSSWFLQTVFHHLFCILTCVFEQSSQSFSWIVNSFSHYFMNKCHKIMKIQWITIKDIQFCIRCWLFFHQMALTNFLWRKPFILLFSLVYWIYIITIMLNVWLFRTLILDLPEMQRLLTISQYFSL